jgi:hypothetical protein
MSVSPARSTLRRAAKMTTRPAASLCVGDVLRGRGVVPVGLLQHLHRQRRLGPAGGGVVGQRLDLGQHLLVGVLEIVRPATADDRCVRY